MTKNPYKLTTNFRNNVVRYLRKGVGRREAFSLAGVSHNTMYMWMTQGEKDDKEGRDTDFAKLARAVQKAEGDLVKKALDKIEVGKDVEAWEYYKYMQARLDRKEANEQAERDNAAGGMGGYTPPPVGK